MKTITVGRSEVCDIIINESNISRIHAEITLSDGKYTFRDVSTNGSSVNGRSLINSEVTINSNSSILLAHSIPLYWTKIESLLPAGGNPISGNKTEFSPSYETSDKTQAIQQNKKSMFRNSFSFDGRIRRTEFGISIIIYAIIASIINVAIKESHGDAGILGFAYIPMLWFIWAQGAKRCHDMNNNGWFQIIPFYLLWMIFAEGDLDSNEYGINPK
jgi:uncharacterized membrane protein YhaH (DUF805 family)